MEMLWLDIRYGMRMLRRIPASLRLSSSLSPWDRRKHLDFQHGEWSFASSSARTITGTTAVLAIEEKAPIEPSVLSYRAARQSRLGMGCYMRDPTLSHRGRPIYSNGPRAFTKGRNEVANNFTPRIIVVRTSRRWVV